ncbi:MAG: hypothetical protein J7485_06210, partial [Sphingobium sp.]|nr:hypothetical protein [Sphingobium sp.]
ARLHGVEIGNQSHNARILVAGKTVILVTCGTDFQRKGKNGCAKELLVLLWHEKCSISIKPIEKWKRSA